MSYGALIKNQSNEILIDGDFRNFKWQQNLVIPNSSNGSAADREFISHTPSALPPLIAVKTPYKRFVYESAWRPNSSASFNQFSYYQPDGGAPITAAVFNLDGAAGSSDTYAMQVFDAAGDEVYDSRKKYLKVEDVVPFNATLGKDKNDTQLITHAYVAAPYYVVSNLFGIWLSYPYSGRFVFWSRGIRYVNGTTAELGWIKSRSINNDVYRDNIYAPDSSLIVCSIVGG